MDRRLAASLVAQNRLRHRIYLVRCGGLRLRGGGGGGNRCGKEADGLPGADGQTKRRHRRPDHARRTRAGSRRGGELTAPELGRTERQEKSGNRCRVGKRARLSGLQSGHTPAEYDTAA